jgi:hypothetical protein
MCSFSIATTAALTTALAFAGAAAIAQSANEDASSSRVFGYQDTRTGIFHPLSAVKPAMDTAAVAAGHVSGTIKILINTKLLTPLNKAQQAVCGATIEVISLVNTPDPIEQRAVGTESVNSKGTAALCTIELPVEWVLAGGENNYYAVANWYVEVVNPAVYPKVRRAYVGEYLQIDFPADGDTVIAHASNAL